MRVIKTFAIIALLYGLFHISFSFIAYNLSNDWHSLIELSLNDAQAKTVDIDSLANKLFVFSIFALIVAVLSLVAALGMFQVEEWGRKLWLSLMAASALAYLFSFIRDAWQGMIQFADVLGYFLIGCVVLASWHYLTQPAILNLFQNREMTRSGFDDFS